MEIKTKMKRTRGMCVCAFIFLFILILFTLPITYASNNDLEMTEELLTTIFEHYSDSRYNNYYNSNYQAGFNQSIPNLLNSVNKTQAVTKINEQLDLIKPNIDSGINNNDIVVEFFWNKGSWGAQLTFFFFVPKETIRKDNFLMLTYNASTNRYDYYIDFINHSRNDYEVVMTIDVNPYNTINSIYYGYNNFANTGVTSNTESLQINNSQISLPFLLAFKNNCGINYNSNVYYLSEYIEQEQSYIEEQTISENGYYLWEGNAIQVKLDDANKLLNTYFFIGDNLTYKNEYFYYNNSGDKINTRGLVEEIKGRYPQSGDSKGYIIQPSSQWVRYYDFYPNEIYEDLTIYYYSGDELLEEIKAIENKKVITWIDSNNNIVTGTTGTITNSSGDVIGNFSGDNDETNLIGYLTQQPNLENKTITQNDLTEAIGITQITNPYTNMWTTLLNGFQEALTEEIRTIYITFKGKTYAINLDDYTLQIPQEIKNFLAVFTTTITVLYISKFTKYIIDDISTASLGGVMDKLTDDFTTNFM